jgi:N utilization substance protein B
VSTDLRDEAFWSAPVQEPLLPRTGRRQRGSREAARQERLETRARARALQALYAADVRDLTQLRRIAMQVFDDLAVDPAERAFASRLVATAAEHGPRLDAELSEVTANWRLERLGAVERSVLRLAAAEPGAKHRCALSCRRPCTSPNATVPRGARASSTASWTPTPGGSAGCERPRRGAGAAAAHCGGQLAVPREPAGRRG